MSVTKTKRPGAGVVPRCRDCGGERWTADGRCADKACNAFPTLGYQIGDFIEAHCVIPDRDMAGEPFMLTDEQWRFLLRFYRVRPQVARDQRTGGWRLPFYYNRGAQLTRPQKWGKGPFSAAIICAEAAGPVVFDGWDADGQPVGREQPTPVIQVTALSEDQAGNVWSALVPMIELGAFHADIPDTGLTRINLPGGGKIEPVTSSARSRLGQRLTFIVQDQALALDTPIPSPNGWTTMGELVAGDVIFGSDGRPTVVTEAKPPRLNEDCFRVTFSDGTDIVASDGHLWATKVAGSQAKPRIRTTGEMFRDGRKFRIPAPGPHQLPAVDLPVDPYLLGLWLGNGHKGAQYISVHEDDVAPIQHELKLIGITTDVRRDEGAGKCAQIKLSNSRGYQASQRPEWAKALQALPCYHDKHVPDAYFRGSIEQRTALVQGLMDSDGHVTQDGHCTFVGSDQLSSDLLVLLRSLGQVVGRVWRDREDYTAGGIWRVNFKPRGGLVPFRNPRKLERVKQQKGTGAKWVSIADIQPIERVPVRCIAVAAPDRLFLAGVAGHVTHNTESWTKSNGGRTLADNQRRNVAGMGGRWLSTPNAWDPAEESVAQHTSEHEHQGVYHDDVTPPDSLSIRNKRERRKALKIAYGDSWWVDLDRIDAEIEALLPRDPAQAERWFLNRKNAATGRAFDGALWDALASPREIAAGELVVLGIDGARARDALAIVATCVETGYQWPVGIWERPEAVEDDYEHPFDEIDGALVDVFDRFQVWRAYVDPQHITGWLEKWQGRWGDSKVLPWWTNRPRPMAFAVRTYTDAVGARELQHDGDRQMAQHVKNAVRMPLRVLDDEGQPMHGLQKDRPNSPRKIDAAIAGVLSWEARGDAVAAGARPTRSYKIRGFA